MSPTPAAPRVVILGAGVNGCSLARELALNGVSVWVVDAHDIAFGATSKSSRLIHGGLRYLEYGEFGLVRESLAERERLRRLAPHFVTPLRLYIPVSQRFSGLLASAFKFLGASRFSAVGNLASRFRAPRGLWLVRVGLWLYDRFAASRQFPAHSVVPTGTPGVPRLDPGRFPWLCAYSDAQIWATERFTVALLEDARSAASDQQVDFQVLTRVHACWDNDSLVLTSGLEPPDSTANPAGPASWRIRPELIVNATGAWGDRTLTGLRIPSPPLFGGTKGSHILTWHAQLRDALQGQAVYAEAGDGRLVFILPFGETVMIGTTDERFEGPPEEAVTGPEEITYLIGMVNELFPEVNMKAEDVLLHYSGVRPLPRQGGATAAVSRDHAIVPQLGGPIPILTLVGGKLTTCRAFGELAGDEVLKRLGVERTAWTRDRELPGCDPAFQDPAALDGLKRELAEQWSLSERSAEALLQLFGGRAATVLRESGVVGEGSSRTLALLSGTDLPRAIVSWVIRNEWAHTLSDLVERRLMLVFRETLRESTLRELADELVAAGWLQASEVPRELARLKERLQRFYGRTLQSAAEEPCSTSGLADCLRTGTARRRPA